MSADVVICRGFHVEQKPQTTQEGVAKCGSPSEAAAEPRDPDMKASGETSKDPLPPSDDEPQISVYEQQRLDTVYGCRPWAVCRLKKGVKKNWGILVNPNKRTGVS